MLTFDDIKKLSHLYLTKREAQDMMDKAVEQVTKVVNDRSDTVMGEIKEMREESASHRQEHDDLTEKITRIESTPTVAHELKIKN